MKKIIAIAAALSLSACGDPKTIDGVYYDTYGLFSKDEVRSDKVQYKLVMGNVVWGALLFETVIAPIYFFGFSLYEPVGLKTDMEKRQ